MKNNCTIVILSFNVKDITDQCLSKAKIAARFCQKKLNNRIEIFVVDNGSTDGTVEMIQRKYKEVTLIRLPKNTGVARGYNTGMREAKTPYILLINSDTFLQKATIFDSITYMSSHPHCDVVTGIIIGLNEKFRGIGGYLPTPFKTIRWLLGIEYMPFFGSVINRIYADKKDFTKEQKREWIPTCFFFMRRGVFIKTRGHDEKMFLYMEDLEWCKRIQDKGMHIYYTPRISATHLGGESTSKKTDISYAFLLQRNVNGLLYYHSKHYPKTVWLIKLALIVGCHLREGFYLIMGNGVKALEYKNVIVEVHG